MQLPIQLAVLISGGGTTLQNLIDRIDASELPEARIGPVIASRSGIAGIDRARNAGLKVHLVDRTQFNNSRDFSQAIFDICDQARVDLVCLAGWLSMLEIPRSYPGKIINIHPALLPSFGGRGMYGTRVHQAVLEHGCKVSGCTVHFVDEQYDNGPIILQRCCPVLDDDTPQTLAHRVFKEEKVAYPQAIQLFAKGLLRCDGRRVSIGEMNLHKKSV
jgi:phosphoribosylglycinamide formyltransferase 1